MVCRNIFDKWAVIALIISVLFLKKISPGTTSSKKMGHKVDDILLLVLLNSEQDLPIFEICPDQFFTEAKHKHFY